MKFNLGAYLSGVTGSLGGTTFIRRQAGIKSSRKHRVTSYNQQQRRLLGAAAQSWRTIPESSREQWRKVATPQPTGYYLYCQRYYWANRNMNRQFAGVPQMAIKPAILVTPSITVSNTGFMILNYSFNVPSVLYRGHIFVSKIMSPGTKYHPNQYVSRLDLNVTSPVTSDLTSAYTTRFGRVPRVAERFDFRLVISHSRTGEHREFGFYEGISNFAG